MHNIAKILLKFPNIYKYIKKSGIGRVRVGGALMWLLVMASIDWLICYLLLELVQCPPGAVILYSNDKHNREKVK